jgi:hypothetical protein
MKETAVRGNFRRRFFSMNDGKLRATSNSNPTCLDAHELDGRLIILGGLVLLGL